MTDATLQNTNQFIGDELNFLSPDEVKETKSLDHLTEYYIRGSISPDSIDRIKKALVFDDGGNGKRRVEVTEPWVLYISPEGEKFVINGNRRRAGYIHLQNDTSHKDVEFYSVPYRVFLKEPTPENLLGYQQTVNDTGEEHNIVALADTAMRYKTAKEQEYIAQGKKTRDAQKLATADLKTLFGNDFSDSYITRLKKISSAPSWLKEMVNKELLTAKAIQALDVNLKKSAHKDLDEAGVIAAIRAEMLVNPDKGLTISDTMVNTFFKDREKALSGASSGDGGGVGGDSSGSSSSNGSGSGKTKEPKTSTELTNLIVPVTKDVYLLETPEDEDNQHSAKIFDELLSVMALVAPMLKVDSKNGLLVSLTEVFTQLLGNTDEVVDLVSGDTDKVYRAYHKLAVAIKRKELSDKDVSGSLNEDEEIIEDEDEEIIEDEDEEIIEEDDEYELTLS